MRSISADFLAVKCEESDFLAVKILKSHAIFRGPPPPHFQKELTPLLEYSQDCRDVTYFTLHFINSIRRTY